MKYTVCMQPTEEGYAISCPELPGCWSQGKTREEAIESMRDAIVLYLSARHGGDGGDELESLVPA